MEESNINTSIGKESNLQQSSASINASQGSDQKKQEKQSSFNLSTIKCEKATIQGKVTWGKGCIVHPNAQIIAEGGEIIIKDFNIIEEKVRIYNRLLKDKNGNIVNKVMKIGSYNHFEAGSILETSDVGSYNTFQNKCHVEINCKIKDQCIIGVGVRVPIKTQIDDMFALSYPGQIVKNTSFRVEDHKYKILCLYELLHNLLPKYNKILSK